MAAVCLVLGCSCLQEAAQAAFNRKQRPASWEEPRPESLGARSPPQDDGVGLVLMASSVHWDGHSWTVVSCVGWHLCWSPRRSHLPAVHTWPGRAQRRTFKSECDWSLTQLLCTGPSPRGLARALAWVGARLGRASVPVSGPGQPAAQLGPRRGLARPSLSSWATATGVRPPQ